MEKLNRNSNQRYLEKLPTTNFPSPSDLTDLNNFLVKQNER